MSFASQIISSINNSDSNQSTTSADSDIGFKSDINTQIKETTIPKPVSSTNSSSSTSSSSSSLSTSSLSTSSPFLNMTAILIFIAIVILLVLQRYNIGLFGYLGDMLDNLINIVYDLFKPLIDKINEILFGSIKSGTQTTAIGTKKLANENAEFVDDLTDNVIENKKIKINKKLEKDILKNNKEENIDDDEVDSSIQQANNEWCYIGSDQNIRKCVKHGESVCMSGLVFPTQEKCINNV
jgi:hypothetical protein